MSKFALFSFSGLLDPQEKAKHSVPIDRFSWFFEVSTRTNLFK
jgi:hypothetical protein